MPGLRGRFWLWTATVAALAAVFVTTVAGHLRVETDILAMLPDVDRDPVVERSVRALSDTTGRRTLFLVGAADLAQAAAAARAFAGSLAVARVFSEVRVDVAHDARALDALYGPHRAVLLSDRHRARLAAGEGAKLVQESLRALYTPAGWLRGRPFADDPLGLYGDFLAQQVPSGGRLRFDGGVLAVTTADATWVLVTAHSDESAFSIAAQQRIEPVIVAALSTLRSTHPRARVVSSGVIRHAAANAARAKAEISSFGAVSLAGVVLLVLLTFRALRPLLLTLLSLGVGSLAALTACHFLFDKVHLITLVFGSTLIGVGVDYSLHFFADRFRQAGEWDTAATLSHVGPAIAIGMLATALGYQAFLLPPFPGLRQMAVFSVVGVAAACACVLLWYPLLAGQRAARHEPWILAQARRLGGWRPRWTGSAAQRAAALALLAFVAGGLWQLRFVDDIRALQSSPDWLREEEAQAREILGGASDTRFFLVEGDTPEATLQHEEALRDALDRLIGEGRLVGYQAVSRALPSARRQRENHALQKASVHSAGGALAQILTQAGYPRALVETRRAAFPAEPPILGVDAWLASPASAALRSLWLGDTGRGHASAVTVGGITDLPALAALELPGVRFVDRVSQVSDVMARYRTIASFCLLAAYGVIGVVLAWRYGPRTGLRLLTAPLGAAAITLAAFGWLAVDANLFNVLALLLVLGMGVDYAVFMHEGGTARATVIMAILLAGLMTLLSFGMLAFSATPFIRSLGLTVLVGVSSTFILALLSSMPRDPDNSRRF